MSGTEVYITRFSAWAPGFKNDAEWKQWACGKREMHSSPEGPEITFTDSLFRRRLSQISKMTIQVVHDLLPVGEDVKMIFLSFRGELSRQYKINKMQIEDGALMPAAFSLSVFNAPAALASMAFGLKGGYTAIYPGKNSFAAALAAAKASLLSGLNEEIIFIYADEEPPPEYAGILQSGSHLPFAFGFVLNKKNGIISFSSLNEKTDSPQDFLKSLFLCREGYVSA